MMNMEDNLDLSEYRAQEEDTCRIIGITKHKYRGDFQRDRDRILYSKEFRRLSGKTQIFVTGSDDNIRTRLTHTIEVAQIAETISERLHLNSMLTRAIALGHDIGHTPFGHVGERTLNYVMNGCYGYHGYENMPQEDKGFKHNLQSVRVACSLEQNLDENNGGLNLTKYTLWGMMHHSELTYKKCEYCKGGSECRYKNNGKKCPGIFSVDYYNTLPYKPNDKLDWTLEAVIVAYADEIAQKHHDLEDGIYAGIIDIEKICDCLTDTFKFDEKIISGVGNVLKKDKSHQIRELSKIIVDSYVSAYSAVLFEQFTKIISCLKLEGKNDWKENVYEYVSRQGKNIIKYFDFTDEFKKADNSFSEYLKNNILSSYLAQCMDGKASYIIRQLVKAYLTNPQQLPDNTIISIIKDWDNIHSVTGTDAGKYMTEASKARDRLKDLIKDDDYAIGRILLRRICDHIAGMTDQYAMSCFERLYGSKGYEYR
ncbi:MAG: dNTP triphosphohydrolase [Lachnospiraceae bacterium]|nr:dNTP triphosphohydrolase [Lachnospiraceae bacterium]